MQDLFWVNLSQPIPLTATHHPCDSIVTDSTLRIRECLTRLTSLLEERSLALLKCAHFDTALRDTNAILKLDPTRALGYLLQGKLYAYYGQQQKAIEVFDQGLTMARGTDDGEQQRNQQQLLTAKADAELMQQKGVDFISKLPLDVVSTSIVPLLMDDEKWNLRKPCPYLQVSKCWRERFARGKLCYVIDDNEPYPAQVVSLCDNVHSMEICNNNPHEGYGVLGQLSTLRRMWVARISPINESNFLSCLRKVGASLHDLEIWLTQGAMLNVRDIMERCPHLSRLITYQVSSADLLSTLHPYPHFMRPMPSLVTLELCELRHPVNHQHALSLLQHYPSLQSLTLYPCHDSDLLPMIHQHCPSLQYLVISTQSSIVPPPPRQRKDNQHGLRSIFVQDENAQYYNIEDIRQCMMTHNATLESVTILVGTLRDDPDPPTALQFPQLRYLSYAFSERHGPPLFGWWMPYHTPILEHVELTNDTLRRSPSLREALCSMVRIRTLGIHAAHGDIQPLLQLIETMEHHGCLEQLVISPASLPMRDDTMRRIISKLTHLKRLSLGKRVITSRHELFNYVMLHLATRCHHLCELDIQADTAGLNTGLLVLSTLDHLERIALSAMDLSTHGIMALEKFPRLRHLILYGTRNPELKHELERLRQTHPQLKISWRDI
ncbi:hypothetical protein O0I10_011752 [Lichtheimia ornata]|uniref:Uncharacterized protein n=1 Tax=Lichtheimia ornata TaxID=688661 RepID=A0AAD7UT25_9FUNG|nr:uncharacterized protein O0I10_011752 [Lichtheimia ornata]KAJ8652606.1 hypothetical protein O0I10_011752 [Lichtheimia ornata]